MNTFLTAVCSKIFVICPKTKKIVRIKPTVHAALFPVVALLALLWVLVRVTPKPSRAAYPCQQMAMGLCGTFFAYLAGSAVCIKLLGVLRNSSKYTRAILLASCILFGGVISVLSSQYASEHLKVWAPTGYPNEPIGQAKGIFPGRVVRVQDSSAISWDGQTGCFWEDRYNDQNKIDAMHSRLLQELAGESTDAAAWTAIFRHFNRQRGAGDVGYQPGERIAIKINMNTARRSTSSTNLVNALPHTVLSLVDQLVRQAGVPPENISVYDASRYITDDIANKVWAVYPKINFVDRYGENDRLKAEWVADQITYSAPNRNGTSLPTVVTEATYLINYALLKPHGTAGITLTAKNHYGSIERQEHETINSKDNGMGTYTGLVDLMAHKDLGKKTLLFLIDGLYAAHGSDPAPAKWNILNNDWPASLFASLDPVAIDSVGCDVLLMEFGNMHYIPNCDNYLHEAALIATPPSGTRYQQNGNISESLGVHEHWNNAIDQQYSRNLGTGDGIELIDVNLGPKRAAIGIQNGSFETLSGQFIANWSVPGPQYTQTRRDHFDGDACLQYKGTGQTETLKQGSLLRRNTNYSLRARMKLELGTDGNVTLDTDDVFDATCQFVVNSDSAGKWMEFSGEFNSGETDSLMLRFFASKTFNGTAYLDQVELIELPKAPNN